MFSTNTYVTFSIFCFSLFAFSCKSNKTEGKKEGFYIETKIDSIKIEDGFKYILIKSKLINNTPNTITYINYNCSWTDAYLTDNKKFDVYSNECNHNSPVKYDILPDSAEKQRIVKILSDNHKNVNGMKFRIGFIYIPFRSPETFDEDARKLYIIDSITHEDKNIPTKHIRKNDKATIIWSDTLTVP